MHCLTEYPIYICDILERGTITASNYKLRLY